MGQISKEVEILLGISVSHDRNIYLGKTNLEHMKKSHPRDFEKYGDRITDILRSPDYVGQNPNDGSIEFVKVLCDNDEFVKVAVRLSQGEKYYARSLYVLNNNRVNNFIKKGTLKKT